MSGNMMETLPYTGPMPGTPEWEEEHRRQTEDWIRQEREIPLYGTPEWYEYLRRNMVLA